MTTDITDFLLYIYIPTIILIVSFAVIIGIGCVFSKTFRREFLADIKK